MVHKAWVSVGYDIKDHHSGICGVFVKGPHMISSHIIASVPHSGLPHCFWLWLLVCGNEPIDKASMRRKRCEKAPGTQFRN